jgi:hypothetical protein
MSAYQCGNPSNDEYIVEVLRRARWNDYYADDKPQWPNWAGGGDPMVRLIQQARSEHP